MRVLGQMILVSMVIGTAMSTAGTGRIDLSLVFWESLAWAFVPVIQLATGLVLVSGGREALGSRLTAYFDTHRPWSLWLLIVAGGLVAVPRLQGFTYWIAPTIVVPVVFTVRSLTALCRDRMGMTVFAARRRVTLHQGITWTIFAVYFALSVALWPRIVSLLQ